MNLEELYEIPPYSLSHDEKERVMRRELLKLTEHHRAACPDYSQILKTLDFHADACETIADLPFIPVRLFKEYELRSVAKEDVAKTMTSSGTSGQQVSKIFLDRENVRRQTKTLASIITDFIGKQRLPLMLLDTEQIKRDRSMFSARGAGIIGFTTFGHDVRYALDADMALDIPGVTAFLKKHRGETILLFGYTYMIWEFIVRALEEAGETLPIEKGILFHIGGWKKLKDQAVDTQTFNSRLNAVLGGNVSIYNYYGMAEQLGSVFVECEHGHMHCSNYSDILIRNPMDFSSLERGRRGLIELLSLLPISYPGHILLTEDEGEILGEDDCPCGRKGKYFKIHGRIKGAEIRGCSDTYERR